ncbi:MAG: DUF3943 domain-containing protein, partial [Caldimonas sp.]
MHKKPPSLALVLGGLAACASLVCVAARADEPTPPAATRLDLAPDKSYAIPLAEIVGFDFLLNRYNRRFSGSTDYDVTWRSIRHNLRGAWVVDNDPFQVNQFAHPYQGSIYHDAARSSGLSYWEAAAYTFGGSVWWEMTGEQTPPSRNDQVASGIAGSFLGEPLFRMAYLLRNSKSDVPYLWRQLGAAAISPATGFNRLVYGSRFDSAFVDHDPLYYSRLRIGASHVTHDDLGSATDVHRDAAEIGFSIDYGLPGKSGYTYERPFDYFSFQTVFSSANSVESLTSRGLLFGTDYGVGDNFRGIFGLYGNYDYLSPQIFHLSTTALSLGTTGQWWMTKDVSLEGTVLAGMGYAAASTQRGVANDRDYHYGMAPRVGLAFRATQANQAALDVSASRYYLGGISNRSSGSDDVSRVETALTWRLHGRHAIGVRYTWSHRQATY